MRSHERLNRRSASVSGESRQVTESGVTEPGLQAGSPTYRGSDLRWNDFQTRRGYIGGTCAIESLIQSVAGASAGFGHQVAIRCSDTIRDRFWPPAGWQR